MCKINNFFRFIFLLSLTFFMSENAVSQLSKSQLPKTILIEKKDNTPSQLEFKGDKMIMQTDPNKSTGTQYTVEYKMEWNGNKFNLISIVEISSMINDAGEKITTTYKKTDFFGYSYLKNWSLTLDENGNYTLASSDNIDYQWVFVLKQ